MGSEMCIRDRYKSTRKDKELSSVLFVMSIGAVDVTKFSDTEKRIRNAIGWPIVKDLVNKLNLPCPTEWVLTTQQFINKITKEIDRRLTSTGSTDLIDLFKELKFNSHKEPSWVKLKDFDGVKKVIQWEY